MRTSKAPTSQRKIKNSDPRTLKNPEASISTDEESVNRDLPLPSAMAASQSSIVSGAVAENPQMDSSSSSGKKCGPWTRIRDVGPPAERKLSSGERDKTPWAKKGGPTATQPRPPVILVLVTQQWTKEVEKYETWQRSQGVLYNRTCTYPDGSTETESDVRLEDSTFEKVVGQYTKNTETQCSYPVIGGPGLPCTPPNPP